MKVTHIISEVNVIGMLWSGEGAGTTYRLSNYDIENCKDDGVITRDSVERWLTSNSGDFQSIIDFEVAIGDNEFDSDWSISDSEDIWYDLNTSFEDWDE